MRRTMEYIGGNAHHAVVVLGTLAIVIFVASLGSAIGGSYLLTISYFHTQQAKATAAFKAQQTKATAAEVAQARGSCRALEVLDHARNGIVFPKVDDQHPSEEALVRIFNGIHGVVVTSHCTVLLSGNFHFVNGVLVPGRAR